MKLGELWDMINQLYEAMADERQANKALDDAYARKSSKSTIASYEEKCFIARAQVEHLRKQEIDPL